MQQKLIILKIWSNFFMALAVNFEIEGEIPAELISKWGLIC